MALADFVRDPRSSDSLRGIVFPKKTHKLLTKFPGLAASDRHNSAMRTDCRILTAKINLYRMSSFHFYRWNQLKLIPLPSTLWTRTKYPQTFRFRFRSSGDFRPPKLRNDDRSLETRGQNKSTPKTPKRFALDYALCDIFVITRCRH